MHVFFKLNSPLIISIFQPFYIIFYLYNQKNRQQKVTKLLHPPAFHLFSYHCHIHNIWMFSHPLATKYHLFFDYLVLGDKIFRCVIFTSSCNVPYYIKEIFKSIYRKARKKHKRSIGSDCSF